MKEYSAEYKRKGYSKRRKMWNYLRSDDIQRLDDYLSAFHVRDRIILQLMYKCGLRIGEIVGGEYFYKVGKHGEIDAHSALPGIMTDDINFGERKVLVHGKGDFERKIPVPAVIVVDFNQYLYKYRAWDGTTNVRLITKHKDESPITSDNVRMMWSKVKKNLKLRKEIRLHDLRHTYAMTLVDQGVDIRDIMNLMGHSSIDTTQIYIEKSTEDTLVDKKVRKIMDGETDESV